MIKQVRSYCKNDKTLYAVTYDGGRVDYFAAEPMPQYYNIEAAPEDVKKFMETHTKRTIMTINGFETIYE